MVFCSTDISLHPSTFEASYKVEDVYEAESAKTVPCVDVVFTHPVSVGVTQDELVQDLLYLVADCRCICV